MTRLITATVVGLAAALWVASSLGGRVAAGVLAGYAFGASLTGLGVLYLRHVTATRPERALHALVVAFLAKLAAVLVGVLALRFVDAAAARADWRSFLVAFAAAVAAVLPMGTMDVARGLRNPSTDPGPSRRTAS